MRIFSLDKFPVENKTILVRVDYNVPLDENKKKVIDNSRIKISLPTIKYLLKNNCKIILMTHLGRPKGKVVEEFRLNPIFKELKKLLPTEKITKLNDCIGKEVVDKIKKGKPKQIFLLENLRFYKEEEENDYAFAGSLARLADVYVNDAFSVSHRAHASVQAITKYLPSLCGFQLKKEILSLNSVLASPGPAVWILGGAKLDKINLIKQALKKADYILIGGALSFSFMKAQGKEVGLSKIDSTSVQLAADLLKRKEAQKIILPVDFMVTESFTSRAKTKVVEIIKNKEIALDIGPRTIKLFKQYLRRAVTIFWNGPLGYYEWSQFATGTKEIGKFLGTLTATSICGGGETAEAIEKFHLGDKISHISSGGGAALAFISGEKLPAIEALGKNYLQFSKRMSKLTQ